MKNYILIIFALFISTNANSQTTRKIKSEKIKISRTLDVYDSKIGNYIGSGKLNLYETTWSIKKRTKIFNSSGNKVTNTKIREVVVLELKNASCFNIEYNLVMLLHNTPKGTKKSIKIKEYLKAGEKKVFGRVNMNSGFNYYSGLVLNASVVLSNNDKISEENPWQKDKKILKCLGFNSSSKYNVYVEKKLKKREEEKVEEDRKKAENLKIKEEERKEIENKWLRKGISAHIKKYRKNRIDGFYTEIPADSLEIIAKHLKQPLLLIDIGGTKYKKGLFKINESLINFLKNNVSASITSRFRSSKWVLKKGIKVKYSPFIILISAEGKVKVAQSTSLKSLQQSIERFVHTLRADSN